MEEKNKRILVVDDEQDLCEILSFNLETEGYLVDTANSAEEALQMDVPSYHLLLLDVMMGGMSGFQMAKHLKENPVTHQNNNQNQGGLRCTWQICPLSYAFG